MSAVICARPGCGVTFDRPATTVGDHEQRRDRVVLVERHYCSMTCYLTDDQEERTSG